MSQYNKMIQDELRRLEYGPQNAEPARGAGIVRFVIKCTSDPENVLNKVRSLLGFIDHIALDGWLSDEQWATRLPEWFVSACAKPMTAEEATRWLVWWKCLSREEQISDELNKTWSLDNWIYWMKSENRQWYWWDAKLDNDAPHIFVAVQVECWPFPWGALRWLFKAAGASEVIAEEA